MVHISSKSSVPWTNIKIKTAGAVRSKKNATPCKYIMDHCCAPMLA